LKTHEIAGELFDNEYDLAMAVMIGMENSSQKRGYAFERFKFKSTQLLTTHRLARKSSHPRCSIYIDIKDGKIWIQHDGTEVSIATLPP
jgi:hypothetical protein